jgi:hypothetical protein
MRQSAKIKLGGGGLNALTKDTILRGKGQNITDIDYDNIINNRLVFQGPELFVQKTAINTADITCNIVYFNSNLYYYKKDIDSIFQPKLIPNLGIKLTNNNISVNFSDGGWTSNYNYNKLYTLTDKLGIGTSTPLSTLHIKNNDASLIIENNDNKFKFNYDNNNNTFILGYNDYNQFHIHKEAKDNSLSIDTDSTVNIGYNININGNTNLTSNIKIGNTDIIQWLTSDKKIATEDFVKNNKNLTPESILFGDGNKITNLDYKNITSNKLIFLNPLIYNQQNNTIDIDLTATGWTNNNSNTIYSSFNSKIGIGTSEPLGTLHIGSTYNNGAYDNNGTLIISRTFTSININYNNNFKLGYDDTFNFVFGNLNKNNNIWSKQFYINANAPSDSLIINEFGNINIKSNLLINGLLILNKNNLNYNLDIDNNNNFNIANNIFINNNGLIGIGTNPDIQNNNKLYINGNVKILSDLYVNDIYANDGLFNIINVSNLKILENLDVLLNITGNNINTNLLSSTNIKTNNINATNYVYAKNILSSNTIFTSYINTNDIICSNNINVFNRLNVNNINTTNINSDNINSDNIDILYNLNSSNINVTNDLTVLSNIYTNLLLYSSNDIIAEHNIYSKTIQTTDINSTNSISTYSINSKNIINEFNITTNDIITLNIETSNIKTSFIDTLNIKTKNINVSDTIISSNIINEDNLISYNLLINNKIDTYLLNSTLINTSKIGINTLLPESELHICNNTDTSENTSLIISGINHNFKIGYTFDDNFVLGNYNDGIWKSQIYINSNAPSDTIIIKESGNILMGTVIFDEDLYKLNVIGSLNAIQIFENGNKILDNDSINVIINNKLNNYLSLSNAEIKYPTKYDLTNIIDVNTNSLEYLITSLLSFNSNIFTNENRYPYKNIINVNNSPLLSNNFEYYVNGNIYAIKEFFSETIYNIDNSEITRNYTIYYSSAKTARSIYIINKNNLFNYNSYNISCSWNENNYKYGAYKSSLSGNSVNIDFLNNSKIISKSNTVNNEISRYYGDFIIIEFDFDVIFTKFRFYILNDKVANAPSMWRCYVSNDADTWILLKDASNDIIANTLNTTNYININNNYSYYEKNFINYTKYKYIGFVFNKILGSSAKNLNLELLKIEIYGRNKLAPLYISSNVLNNILTNYTKNDYINNNIQRKIEVSEPLEFDGTTLMINPMSLYNINSTIPEIYDGLSNSIISYINSKTDIWTRQSLANNIYYTSGTIGIGTTLPNPLLDNQLKLNVYGNINVSNINISNNINVNNTIYANNIITTDSITALKYNGNGSLLTNINYNNIVANKPNLTNLNNWNLLINNNISNCYNILDGNIGIGYALNTQLNNKLSVNGNIYSTSIINGINLQENSINISDKYLTIANANTNFLKLSGGIITGSIGIGTDISPDFKVNINGSLNATTINAINFIENGIFISNKYLTIANANFEYISKINGGIINNNLIILQNLSIGSTTITDNKLFVNGNIYSSNNISCFGNLNEGGSNLSDKYLSISNANSNFLKLSGGIISGSIGIGTDISPNFKININGSLNTNSLYINGSLIDFSFFSTNTSLTSILLSYPTLTFLSDNYISTTNFNNSLSLYSTTGTDPNYLKITGGIITNDTTFSKNLITSNLITSNLTSLNQILTSNLTSLNQIITSNLISLNQIITCNLTTSNINSSNIINYSNIQTNTLQTSSKVSIGSSTLSQYLLFVNGSLNTNSLYINNSFIDFSSYTTNTSLTSTLLSYPTLTFLSDNYISLTNFNNSLLLYSTTGTDPNYLKITGGIITNDTTFSKNLFTSNLISSNIINYSNIQTNTLQTSSKVSIGSSTLSQYLLFVNGSLNTNSLYINNSFIDFSSYTTNTSLTSTLLSYPTLTFLSDNYISLTNFNNSLLLYSTTGTDPNYLKITGGIITNDTTFSKNLFTSNLISSNIITNNLNTSNISNINLISSYSIYAISNISIGTNPSSLYKLNVNGSINSSNNISCSANFIENGSNLIDKYLTITNASNNYFSINGGIINNNVGIGTNISLLYKLNVNGSINSSNNISCSGNFIENGSNLIDKYLTITNASNNYFSINGGSILNNVNILSNLGIGINANNIYKLTVNGAIYSSSSIYCVSSISENGITLNNKYLSLNGGTILNNLTINSNIGIGINASDLYKLNVKGSIYSSNDIICDGNIKENGIYLNNKYLSINGGNIFNNLTINSNVGIGINASDLYKLNVKGSIYSSNDIICDGNIKEGGSNLKDKYLSINDAANIINTEVLRKEISSNQPNVQKKYGFRFLCNKPIILNNETYYKHDVNLSLYIKTKIDSIDANPYRIFGIKCFTTSVIFNNTVPNKPPNILQYDIYTSYNINTSNINITAIGFPSNYYLNRITSGDIFLLKTTNYNYISILSRTSNLGISCIISDFLF